jgi:SAM-dependent methyltransferase
MSNKFDKSPDREARGVDPAEPRLVEADWRRLEELRRQFLAAQEGLEGARPSAWEGERDLELYDAVYGARIGWKWDAFLADALRRADLPAGARVLDLGCGTAVASRALLRHAPAGAISSVRLVDKSAAATRVGARLLARAAPGLECAPFAADFATEEIAPPDFDVLVASHLVDELSDEGWRAALRLARRAELVLWLEGGAKSTSRALQRVREELLEEFEPLLPCTHRESCGALSEANAHEWCHRFARPPREAFTTAHFTFASKRLGLDLRSLPYCGLLLAKRARATPREPGLARLLGRAKGEKGKAMASICDAAGVRRVQILERLGKQVVRAMVDEPGSVDLLRLRFEGGKVVGLRVVDEHDGPA